MKLIVSDLDGTLLNDKGQVTETTAQAISDARDAGIDFMVATGRSYDAAKKPLQDAGIECPFICLNGSQTYDIDGQLINEVTMDLKTSQTILTACQNTDMYIELFTNQGIFSPGQDDFIRTITELFKKTNVGLSDEDIQDYIQQRLQDEEVTFVERLEEVLQRKDIEVYKILSFSMQDDMLATVHNQLKDNQQIALTSSGHMNLEFNHENAQKGIALAAFAQQSDIDLKEVMALGDNLNDKSMLEKVGRSVAMENGAEEIKSICTHQTLNNNDNGVAHAIREMLKELS